ncbi:MAG TPA: metalloregulator ArsR/SmtB family transcription factor [Acidimicrobiales bacterium]|nr:metalloregulator ArsR/SmtB family transcription factor [Acidimicrobiales bacterium]
MSGRTSQQVGAQLSEQLADVMFALSAPSRVQILGCLLSGPRAVGEIVSMLNLEQSAVSHQLRVLREHSLVRVAQDGKRRVYDLYDEAVRELLEAAIRHVQRRGRSRRGSSAAAIGD